MTKEELKKIQAEIESWEEDRAIVAANHLAALAEKGLETGLPHTKIEQDASYLLIGIKGTLQKRRRS